MGLRGCATTVAEAVTIAIAAGCFWLAVEATQLTMSKGKSPDLMVVLVGALGVAGIVVVKVSLLGRLGVIKPVHVEVKPQPAGAVSSTPLTEADRTAVL